MTTAPDQAPVKVRFCPSPTGTPHVGLVRTALYNWAFARHHQLHGAGGSIVFRMEDTDRERSTKESYDAIVDLWHWLGLTWDEGIEVGGPHGPYLQSERGDIYRDVLEKLKASSYTYDCFCTNDEVEARRKASGSKVMGYDGFCRELDPAQRQAFEAEGRRPIVRFRMPDGSITWNDLVRGDITFESEFVPDYALSRANGDPLYTLVNPVDDALMEVTHVLRGEDLLSSTPRQLALYDALKALGIAQRTPEFGHLPYVMGQGNKKLSKRDPEADALKYRADGFLPEGLLNYLALLGWAIAPDNDIFSLEQMVEKFDIRDVNPNPARFDLKKAQAINATHLRMLSIEDLTHRCLKFLKDAGLIARPVSDADAQLLELAMPLVAERLNNLAESVDMLRFLFVKDDEFSVDADDAAKLLDESGLDVVRAALSACEGVAHWSTAEIQEALQQSLIEGLGLKPRVAFGPVRVAVTGRRISPPLFESMELLGRDRSLSRLRAVLA